MSGISKTKVQKERLKSAIDSGGSSVEKLIQKEGNKVINSICICNKKCLDL